MTAKTFTFKHKNKNYSLPVFSDIPMGALRKARKASDDGDRVFIILEQILEEESPTLKAIDAMNAAEFAEFLTGWTQGAQLGE
jgi:hypothetical protein